MTATRPSPSYPWLEPLLAVICLWAGVEAVLAWWRKPPVPPLLPTRIQLHGRWYERVSKASLPIPQLPSGVAVRQVADYQASDGRRLALRWLVNESSGSGVRLEPDKLSTALLGPGRQGFCRVYDPRTGAFLGTASTGGEVKRLLSLTAPRGTERLEWAFGLRPWRQNRCLFVGELP